MSGGLFERRSAAFTRFARVVPERGIDAPEGLTYGVPADPSWDGLRAGERVEAPLGRGDARSAGFVVWVGDDPGALDPARIKPLARRTGLALPERLVELADWMARYYCCPPGLTLAAMAPAAVRQGVGASVRVELVRADEASAEGLGPKAAAAWEAVKALDAAAFPMEPRALASALGLESTALVTRLTRAGLLREVERRVVKAAWDEHAVPPDRELRPTAEQAAAVGAIVGSLGGFRVHLLRGVTGSGKTEVYLRAVDAVLDRGGSAVVLVPEISLTPQTVGRFIGRFRARGVVVAALHSGLTAAQRHHQWSLVAGGEARVVIGARSAIFAPVSPRWPLGLIVVDEEHEDGYKQDQAPRYHGRDVAVKRGQLERCPVVLGSATPSMESWRNALEGRYDLSELTERVGGARLPTVRIVDLAQERRERPWTDQRVHLLGPRLEAAIRRALDARGQVILLLNRRGWGNYICCPDHRCGWTLRCDACDAAMVYHRDRLAPSGGLVRCHHCLAEVSLPSGCPLCGKRVVVFGMGTQRVEEEVTRKFPELIEGQTLLRLDGDTTRTAKHWHAALGRFGSGEVRMLLGTQMIAKGLDFPGVRLVGVVNADTAINLPDFRAAERTFQLVSQVAGRAGRSEDPGEVVVQTFAPESPPITLAATHDYRRFAEIELGHRRRAALPPYSRMARIVVRDTDHARALAHAREIEAALLDAVEPGADAAGEPVALRGPMPCPISRVADHHRIALELTAQTPGALQRAITSARNRGLLKSDARTAVDVDPIALL